ncbi:MAG: hypothetical protein LBS20_11840 [Prevotella sp.]|jgi:hypothetical protein|nr:hypothetical protein [Prevotella sp.]
MKTHEVQLFFAMCLFACISAALGWCSKEVALLIIIIQLQVSIVILLSRIYTAIINQTADLRSDKNRMMKAIKDLTVQVTYRVGLGNLKVSDDIYNGLIKIADKISISDNEANMTKDKDMQAAFEWLTDNIKENDAMSWEYQVEDLTDK